MRHTTWGVVVGLFCCGGRFFLVLFFVFLFFVKCLVVH